MLLNPVNGGEDGPVARRECDLGFVPHEAAGNELERLRARERQMAELLGSASPDRIVHDLRNVLNEVQLLRMLTDEKM